MVIYLVSGVASRSIRRRSRVHGISIEVFRKCPWSYLEDKLCRNLDIAVASYWEGKGLPSQPFEDPILTFLWQTAQAETNNPQWGKAIETIYPKAREMMSKPRYWQVAFPLVIISLCVAPQSYFLKHWQSCFEHAVSKLKVKVSPYSVKLSHVILGKAISSDSYEWFDASHLDLPLPLSRICFDDHVQA